jgi:hypothetical protein
MTYVISKIGIHVDLTVMRPKDCGVNKKEFLSETKTDGKYCRLGFRRLPPARS